MIAFPEMAASCASEVGIKVPDNLEEYDKDEFPHWHVYASIQLGRPMPGPDSHRRNARIIAGIPGDRIRKVTLEQLENLGLE